MKVQEAFYLNIVDMLCIYILFEITIHHHSIAPYHLTPPHMTPTIGLSLEDKFYSHFTHISGIYCMVKSHPHTPIPTTSHHSADILSTCILFSISIHCLPTHTPLPPHYPTPLHMTPTMCLKVKLG